MFRYARALARNPPEPMHPCRTTVAMLAPLCTSVRSWEVFGSLCAPLWARRAPCGRLIVHADREDASVKATGKWKATLVTVAAASSVAVATGAGASAVTNTANGTVDQQS